MKIFPAVHYTMGGLWCDYERNAAGGLAAGSPRTQHTNLPGLFAIGECDYQYHGANRLGANSLLACIFSGLTVAPGAINYIDSLGDGLAGEQPSALFQQAVRQQQQRYDAMLARPADGPNPYALHGQLGRLMTRTATVVRRNADLDAAYGELCELEQQARRCSLADTGNWSNQNAVFARALEDMFPVAKTILKGARARDECRGAHYKPAVQQLLAQRPGCIELRPMSKFPVLRDLVVDRARIFAVLEKVRAWLPVDSYLDMGSGPRQSQEVQQRAYQYSKCMCCGCCLEACPQYLKVELHCEQGETPEHFHARLREANMRSFVGAYAIAQVELFNSNPLGAMNAAERLDALTAAGGIQNCGNAQNCVKVCPQEIPLTRAIGRQGRSTTRHVLQKWFDW